MVSEEAKKYLPKPVITVFKPGAAGTIGAYHVAKAPPDGYTLLMGTVGHIVVAPFIQKLDYTPQDFEIMGQIALNPFTFCVRADAPWGNLKELVAYAKKNPGVVTCGNSGTYTAMHLTAMRFEQAAGIKLTHVPFKGGADCMTNVAGGHASMGIRVLGEGEPLVEAGKVRVLSVFDSKRCKFYPDVPTTKEEGFDVEAGAWAVLMAPKGTPKRILATWENIVKQITHDKAFIEKADKLKMNIEFKSAVDFQK
jgi:tripartite-type tricarboxylate transporter receptor subunit TctC